MMPPIPVPDETSLPSDDPASRRPSDDSAAAEMEMALGARREMQGAYQDARDHYESARRLAPNQATYHTAYALLLAKLGLWRVCRDALRLANSADSSANLAWVNRRLSQDPGSILLRHLRALALLYAGRQPEARAEFEQLVDATPTDCELVIDLASALEAVGESDAAELQLRSAVDRFPDSAECMVAYAAMLEQRGREKEALNLLDRAIDLRPDDPELRRLADDLTKRQSQVVEALKRVALAHLKLSGQDDIEGASGLATEALKMAPNSAAPHRLQAEILARRGQVVRAEIHYRRACELEPENAGHREALEAFIADLSRRLTMVRSLVQEAEHSTNPSVARMALDQALALVADDVDAHLLYAALLMPSEPEDAGRHLQAVLELDPTHLEANRRYAQLLIDQGLLAEAEVQFLNALRQHPFDQRLLEDYADLLRDQGRFKDVVDLLGDPENVDAWSSRLTGALAIGLMHLNRPVEAGQRFEAALAAEPGNTTLHRYYAHLLLDDGRPEDSAKHFQAAIEGDADDYDSIVQYAEILSDQQQHHLARMYVRRALHLRPDDAGIQAKADAIEHRANEFEMMEKALALAEWLNQENPERIAEIVQAYEGALRQASRHPEVLSKYAAFLASQGNIEKARSLLIEALIVAPERRGIQEQLAALPVPRVDRAASDQGEPEPMPEPLPTTLPATPSSENTLRRWLKRLISG